MPDLMLSELDPRDDGALRAYWEVEQAAQRHDRDHPVIQSYGALVVSVREPSAYHARTLLAAHDGGDLVGTAELSRGLRENLHLASLEVNVRPDARRRGVGRALFAEAVRRAAADGRTTILGEVNVPAALGDGAPAPRFADAMGAETVHEEDHLVLTLPVAQRELDRLTASAPDDDHHVVTWGDRCPDEHLEAYAAMRTQMNADVPMGEIDHEPVVVDPARVRAGEERLARSYHSLVAAARRRADGAFGGYSVMYLPHGDHVGWQDDTLVMPEHRGRRLGIRLKLANLLRLRDEHPERTVVHTWTAVDNAPMRRTNADFGFVAVERMQERQLRLDG